MVIYAACVYVFVLVYDKCELIKYVYTLVLVYNIYMSCVHERMTRMLCSRANISSKWANVCVSHMSCSATLTHTYTLRN